MNKKQRLAKRAKALRNITERRDLIVNHEPRLFRVAIVYYRDHPAGDIKWFGSLQRRAIKVWVTSQRRRRAAGISVVRITRQWDVHGYDSWDNLVMAQGQRDGLNYHYARYLMTRGTAAAGL